MWGGTQTTAVVMMMTMSSATAAAPSAYTDWESVLPGCQQARNLFEAAQCIVKNSPAQCFPSSTPVDVYKCFEREWNDRDQDSSGNNNIMGEVMDVALVCLDPYHECIKNGIDNALQQLPPCVQESAMDMATCFLDNPVQCAIGCLAETWDSPFDNLNIFDLLSCDGMQENLLQPMCNVVSCCPPCVDPLEAVAECVVNELLDFGPWGTCDFECQQEEERRRAARALRQASSTGDIVTSRTTSTNSNEQDKDEEAMQIFNKCRSLVPGLWDKTYQPSIQLAARSNFFDCVMKEALALYSGDDEEAVQDSTTADEDEDEEMGPWWCFWCN